jgi:neutral ceramidase
MRGPLAIVFSFACAVVLAASPASAAEWKAGVARVKITPEKPMWMSGYGARTKPADPEPINDLWAKALALDDGQGRRVLMITLDLCGIDRELSLRVRSQIKQKHGLGFESVALCSSHTHSGPVVGTNLRTMYFLDQQQNRLVNEHTAALEQKLIDLAGQALTSMAPARLEWGNGQATFAVNRRNNPEKDVVKRRADGTINGPSDHDLPVLAVHGADGKLKAVLFGYACHATTLSGQQWSSDWPGFAQEEIEKDHPGVTALFFAGCGADQNPLPRRTVELARGYGRQAADGVKAVIPGGKMKPITGGLKAAYSEIDLPYAELPTRQRLEADAKAQERFVASRGRKLLDVLDKEGKLNPTYPYPVQAWKLGDGPTLILLGGEVVVDYSLRLKEELGKDKTWVAGYANDVMAYIPSKRVLKEGGYEGVSAMVIYGLPSPWAPEVEEMIVKEVHRQAGEVGK